MDKFRESLLTLKENGHKVVDMLRAHRSSAETLLELGVVETTDVLDRINREIEHFLILPYIEAARASREEEFKAMGTDGTIRLPDEWEPIPDDAHLFTKSDFIQMCMAGVIIDDDGTGCYALPGGMTHIEVSPSDVVGGLWEQPWTHVVWFDK